MLAYHSCNFVFGDVLVDTGEVEDHDTGEDTSSEIVVQFIKIHISKKNKTAVLFPDLRLTHQKYNICIINLNFLII